MKKITSNLRFKSLVKTIKDKSLKVLKYNEHKKKEYEEYLKNKKAQDEVRLYVQKIDEMTNVHKIKCLKIDWKDILSNEAPLEPSKDNTLSTKFDNMIKNSSNNRLMKVIGFTKMKLKILEKLKDIAINQEKEDYNNLYEKWIKDNLEWDKWNKISKGVLEGDINCYKLALEEVEFDNQIKQFVKECILDFGSDKIVNMKVIMKSKRIIPKMRKKILKNGKVSTVPLKVEERNDIYYKNISSTILLIANVLFNLIPIDSINMIVNIDKINRKNGKENKIIAMKVDINKEDILNLDLKKVSPVEIIENINHTINFSKIKGFLEIKELSKK